MKRTKPAVGETTEPVSQKETFRYVDGVEIALTVLEDIQAISESLDSAVELFKKSHDTTLWKAAMILEPACQNLQGLISNHFPDLDMIRENLVKRGLGGEIRG
jgi:hypothetical protein